MSIVKDMLGHADESTTLKHYIYNIVTIHSRFDGTTNKAEL